MPTLRGRSRGESQSKSQGLRADIRELVTQNVDLESFHAGCRLSPRELRQHYELDEGLCDEREPIEIAIFDDLLTTGSHFKTIKSVLRDYFPDTPISGIFVARRYIVDED
jgi:predicted amidophosphoribosyltransferase